MYQQDTSQQTLIIQLLVESYALGGKYKANRTNLIAENQDDRENTLQLSYNTTNGRVFLLHTVVGAARYINGQLLHKTDAGSRMMNRAAYGSRSISAESVSVSRHPTPWSERNPQVSTQSSLVSE